MGTPKGGGNESGQILKGSNFCSYIFWGGRKSEARGRWGTHRGAGDGAVDVSCRTAACARRLPTTRAAGGGGAQGVAVRKAPPLKRAHVLPRRGMKPIKRLMFLPHEFEQSPHQLMWGKLEWCGIKARGGGPCAARLLTGPDNRSGRLGAALSILSTSRGFPPSSASPLTTPIFIFNLRALLAVRYRAVNLVGDLCCHSGYFG